MFSYSTVIVKYLILLVILVVIEITIAMYLTFWRENFWNSIASKKLDEFSLQILIFTILALLFCFVAGMSTYLLNLTAIEWRKQLNFKALDINNMDKTIINYSQRVQEDCRLYPDLILNLIFGAIKSVIYIITFSIALLLAFHWWFLLALVIYSIIGTAVANYIAKKLLHLNYHSQNAEATYRNEITINNIASTTFPNCIFLMFGLAKNQKRLTYFQSFYNQLGIIFPLLLIAPMYFTTGMTLGMLMRLNSIAATILDNTSYGINQFSMINNMRACRKRLKDIGVI